MNFARMLGLAEMRMLYLRACQTRQDLRYGTRVIHMTYLQPLHA